MHRDLTVRYKRSVFGFLWTMLHPLALMLIFTVVFSTVFRNRTPHYQTYFLSAYVAWTFFAQTTTNSMAALAWNGPLMKRVRVPASIFTISSAVSGLVNLALSLVVLAVIMIVTGAPLRASLIALPLSLALLFLFVFAASLALTSLSVFFADVREMFQAGLPALLYLTPVIYPLEVVPEKFRWFIELNPLTHFIELVRAPIYAGTVPSPDAYAVAAALAAGALVAAWLIFRALAPRFHGRL